jgi:hypothetical protein
VIDTSDTAGSLKSEGIETQPASNSKAPASSHRLTTDDNLD